jgi:hypothetical protein
MYKVRFPIFYDSFSLFYGVTGWLMRLYYQVDPEDTKGIKQLCNLWCEHDHLDLCDVNHLPDPLNNLNELQPIGKLNYNSTSIEKFYIVLSVVQ